LQALLGSDWGVYGCRLLVGAAGKVREVAAKSRQRLHPRGIRACASKAKAPGAGVPLPRRADSAQHALRVMPTQPHLETIWFKQNGLKMWHTPNANASGNLLTTEARRGYGWLQAQLDAWLKQPRRVVASKVAQSKDTNSRVAFRTAWSTSLVTHSTHSTHSTAEHRRAPQSTRHASVCRSESRRRHVPCAPSPALRTHFLTLPSPSHALTRAGLHKRLPGRFSDSNTGSRRSVVRRQPVTRSRRHSAAPQQNTQDCLEKQLLGDANASQLIGCAFSVTVTDDNPSASPP
jgi:hypothetical protein